MKKLVTFLFILISNISLAQTGWGYVNYTSYKTHNGNGSQNQYGAFANTAAEFDNMLNTANSNTTITHTGEVPISYLYNGSLQTPRWNNDYFAYKFEFWFIPQQTGTYYFGTNSDDASDIFIDGVAIATYYGGHGASGYQTGSISMVAGKRYRVVYRGQEFGGGEAFYFQWYRPVGGWGYWTNEVTNVNSEPTKKVQMNFDFGSIVDETKFGIGSALSSTGWIDVTNSIDSVKIGDGYKANVVGGQVEWAYVTNYTNTEMLLNIDVRTFGSIIPSQVKNIKLLDVYDGPVTYSSTNAYWVVYSIPKQTFTPGTYIRDMGAGSYAFKCDITYTQNMVYKSQSVKMTTTNTLSTLYNSIVTVSDVWLAFKEIANVGILGNQSGNEFGYGIQYKNADINDDGIFNEADCFRLLQHLTGVKNIVDTFNLNKTIKLIPYSVYRTIGKSNWNTSPSYLSDAYNFDINTGKAIDTFNISVTWKGDVNLSHSATPPANGITSSVANFGMQVKMNEPSAYVVSELTGDSLIFIIKFNPNSNKIGGTQFQINYDNSILTFNGAQFKTAGSPTNFSTNNKTYITIGSLNTTGGFLDNTTEYRLSFKTSQNLENSIGLVSIATNEAVNFDGKTMKIKIQ